MYKRREVQTDIQSLGPKSAIAVLLPVGACAHVPQPLVNQTTADCCHLITLESQRQMGTWMRASSFSQVFFPPVSFLESRGQKQRHEQSESLAPGERP